MSKNFVKYLLVFRLSSEIGAVFAHVVDIIPPDITQSLYKRLLRISLMAESDLLHHVVKIFQQVASHEVALDHAVCKLGYQGHGDGLDVCGLKVDLHAEGEHTIATVVARAEGSLA